MIRITARKLIRSRAVRVMVATTAGLAAVAPTAQAACPSVSFTQVFAAWNDFGLYGPAPNGDLESGLTGWSVTGSARLVADQPKRLSTHSTQKQSLELPPGSSATSPRICVAHGYPYSRIFGRTVSNPRSSSASLHAEVIYENTRGGLTTLSFGTASSLSSWDPTRRLSLAQGLFDIRPASDGNTYVRYRFTPLHDTTWRIDDLHVDPRLRY